MMHFLDEKHGKREVATKRHTRKERSQEIQSQSNTTPRLNPHLHCHSRFIFCVLVRFISRKVLTSVISILDCSELLKYSFAWIRQCSRNSTFYISSFHIHDRLSRGYLIDKQASDALVILIKFAIVYKLPFSILINKSNQHMRDMQYFIFSALMYIILIIYNIITYSIGSKKKKKHEKDGGTFDC